MQCLPRSTHQRMNILKVGHNFQVLICGMFQLAMFKETFKTNFNVKRQNVLQFCVTQGHMGQRAIAKKSNFLSQHETPPQLSNRTGRSWSCVDIYSTQLKHQKRATYLMCHLCSLLILSSASNSKSALKILQSKIQ